MKGPEYYRLNTNDRVLALSGVPINYLSRPYDLKSVRFSRVSYQHQAGPVVIVEAERQQNFLNELYSKVHALGQPGIYVLSALPTDEPAYVLATDLSRKYYEAKLRAALMPKLLWVDLGGPPWGLLKGEMEMPEVMVIHGLNQETENRRLDIAKDFMRAAAGSTVIVLVRSANGLEYGIEKLNANPDAVLQFGRSVHRKVV